MIKSVRYCLLGEQAGERLLSVAAVNGAHFHSEYLLIGGKYGVRKARPERMYLDSLPSINQVLACVSCNS
jgi:hypothetical protein